MSMPDLLNVLGLALDGSAALLLLATAPISQRAMTFKDVPEINRDMRRDRFTRKAHHAGFVLLATGFLLQLSAQILR